MCSVAGASAGLGILGATSRRRAQRKAAREAIRQATFESAVALAQNAQNQFQAQLAANQEEFERERQGLRERARLRVAIGESGLVGNTTVRQIASSFIQEDIDTGNIEENKEIAEAGFAQQRGIIKTALNSRIKSIKSGVDTKFLSSLKIIQGGVQGFATGRSLGLG